MVDDNNLKLLLRMVRAKNAHRLMNNDELKIEIANDLFFIVHQKKKS